MPPRQQHAVQLHLLGAEQFRAQRRFAMQSLAGIPALPGHAAQGLPAAGEPARGRHQRPAVARVRDTMDIMQGASLRTCELAAASFINGSIPFSAGCTHGQFHAMDAAIVLQLDATWPRLQRFAIHGGRRHAMLYPVRVTYRDHVAGGAVSRASSRSRARSSGDTRIELKEFPLATGTPGSLPARRGTASRPSPCTRSTRLARGAAPPSRHRRRPRTARPCTARIPSRCWRG